jgi:tRNA (cytidine/uridine-2'-O-)-methyltransferase
LLSRSCEINVYPQMRLALFEPDIPQNAGALMRVGACLGVAIDIIEPCGFLFDDARLRRAGMDYLEHARIIRHISWSDFVRATSGRMILLTTKAETRYIDFRFRPDDVLILGRESAGAPEHVHQSAAVRLRIPMASGLRSLNVALTGAMVLGEALRQTKGFP